MTEWPEWLSPLPDSGQQRAIDAWAIDELGIPGVTLMERAGIALADLVDATVPRGPVVVVAGGGNNGGDGLVTARHLRLRGRAVAVLLLAAPEDSSEFMAWGSGGIGRWVTIFSNPGHAYMTVAGLRLDTSAADDPTNQQGPRWRPLRPGNPGFTVRHPLGL